MIKKASNYLVQVGKGTGKYTTKYTFKGYEGHRAKLYYESINVHSGRKKRLVRPDGTVIAREITS